MYIGCHLSSARGFAAMGRDALSIGANTFQFFTRNPRGGRAKAIDPADVTAFLELAQANQFGVLVAHAPYTLNACAAEERIQAFARMCMEEDLARMEYLPQNYYNFHPGSHVGQGAETGIAKTAALLNELLSPAQTTTVLLETMSGQGSEIGGTFEELAAIMDRVELPSHVGVCLDTCHVFAAGYNVKDDLDGVLKTFDRVIGLDRLKALHLNDSMQPLGSHRDRHACIGEGAIGLAALQRLVSHPALKDLPFILETPNELPGYAQEIRLLRDES